jgi:[protein-PII] uridylyltransferase
VDPAPERREGLRAARDALRARLIAGDLEPADFVRAYAAAADEVLRGLLSSATGGRLEGLALVAVGGYGRGELAPGSDLDLLLLHRSTRAVREVAERLWYSIWDEGISLDHAVRTPRDALALAERDSTVLLGLADARLVAGDEALATAVRRGAAALLSARARELVVELARRAAERRALHGELPYLLEPDLKESAGGLRDVLAMEVAARAAPALDAALAPARLAPARGTLARVRVALQARSPRGGDRLLLQEQDAVAAILGLPDADALMAEVASAGRSVLRAAEDGWRRALSWASGPSGRAGGRDVPLADGVVRRDGEVALLADEDPAGRPELVWRVAAEAARAQAPIARATLERLRRSLPGEVPDDGARRADAPRAGGPWGGEVARAFLTLLGCGDAAVPVLEVLDEHGLLEPLIPEWRAVRHLPQRNAYHRYTVDRHLLETAARACDHLRDVARPDLLLLGSLLHDIGKGPVDGAAGGDHSEKGGVVARRVGTRAGLPPEDVETLVRLVRHHLLLADVATRRDLDDPATVDQVAAAVGDRRTLELLAALTAADGAATGPAAWSPWKAGLVEDLVQRVARRLAGDLPPPPSPPAVPVELVESVQATGRAAVRVEGSTVTVVAPDRTGLFSVAAGVLALSGAAVRRALAAPAAPGLAVEVFDVEPGSRGLPPARALEGALSDALDGRLLLASRLAQREADARRGRRPEQARPPQVRVVVDEDASARATVVEVRAPDSPGLLYRVTAVLAAEGLDIVSARVATLGHEAVDAFYVTWGGRRLEDGPRLRRVLAALERAAAPADAAG